MAMDPPRNFREVGIVLAVIQADLEEVKETQRSFMNRLSGIALAIVCPLMVGLILGIIFK